MTYSLLVLSSFETTGKVVLVRVETRPRDFDHIQALVTRGIGAWFEMNVRLAEPLFLIDVNPPPPPASPDFGRNGFSARPLRPS